MDRQHSAQLHAARRQMRPREARSGRWRPSLRCFAVSASLVAACDIEGVYADLLGRGRLRTTPPGTSDPTATGGRVAPRRATRQRRNRRWRPVGAAAPLVGAGPEPEARLAVRPAARAAAAVERGSRRGSGGTAAGRTVGTGRPRGDDGRRGKPAASAGSSGGFRRYRLASTTPADAMRRRTRRATGAPTPATCSTRASGSTSDRSSTFGADVPAGLTRRPVTLRCTNVRSAQAQAGHQQSGALPGHQAIRILPHRRLRRTAFSRGGPRRKARARWRGELLGAIRAMDPRVNERAGASRTDAGVHARGQLAAVRPDASNRPKGWALGLSAHLPSEITHPSSRAGSRLAASRDFPRCANATAISSCATRCATPSGKASPALLAPARHPQAARARRRSSSAPTTSPPFGRARTNERNTVRTIEAGARRAPGPAIRAVLAVDVVGGGSCTTWCASSSARCSTSARGRLAAGAIDKAIASGVAGGSRHDRARARALPGEHRPHAGPREPVALP